MSSLVAVFEDTLSKCRGNQVLADSIQKSLREQKIILEGNVLNFASACNPGGGVTKGAHAREECLCRISTLYPCLNVSKN